MNETARRAIAAAAVSVIAAGVSIVAANYHPAGSAVTLHQVAVVDSPSPDASPAADSPSPLVDSPSPSPDPTVAPSAAPAPAPAPSQAPAPPPAPTCPTGRVLLALDKTGRWDGSFTIPEPCSSYTYKWTYGPVPDGCTTWTLAFYPDVNGQGHTYTEASPASGGGSEVVHHGAGAVAGEVNLYNNSCAAIPWTVEITAG